MLIMTILTDRYSAALAYCFYLHQDQRRKGKSIPYISHLLSVSALVLEDGGDEDEAIAALLHDALEDQPDKTNPDEIQRRFGDRVLSLIESCTDTPTGYTGGVKPAWKARKEKYLEHIQAGAGGALRIALADKLHNARESVVDYHRLGEGLWANFNAGKVEQLWLYRALVDAFRQGGAQGQKIDEYERVVAEFERIVSAGSIPPIS